MRRYICCTPPQSCSGSKGSLGPSGLSARKLHTTSDEVLSCYGRYLESQGYKKLARREFEDPVTGRVLIVPKNPGLPCRAGKSEDGKSGNRYTPMAKGQAAGFV